MLSVGPWGRVSRTSQKMPQRWTSVLWLCLQTAFVSITPSPLSVYFMVTRIAQVWSWGPCHVLGLPLQTWTFGQNLYTQAVHSPVCIQFWGFSDSLWNWLWLPPFRESQWAVCWSIWLSQTPPLISCLFPQFWLQRTKIDHQWYNVYLTLLVACYKPICGHFDIIWWFTIQDNVFV